MASELHTPVLIAGGGVVGLSSALFGAWHHLPCRLVERDPGLVRGRPHAGRRAAAHGIGADGALLVRPDGLVVWGTTLAAADPVRILRTSLRAPACASPSPRRARRRRGGRGPVQAAVRHTPGSIPCRPSSPGRRCRMLSRSRSPNTGGV